MITFDHVRVKFGDFTALPGFDLTIEEGEFFTFLGPSGCGKTTALRTLAGFVTPVSGRVVIDGSDVTRLPSDKRGLGMVFQNYALFPSLTIRENIAFGLQVAKTSKSEIARRVAQIAETVDLSQAQLDKGVAEVSGGQQQRVAIARALVMQPRMMLLDEPLSNLDAKLRHQLRNELKALSTEFGMTTVYVTHDQDEALAMSDRIAVINHGRIEQVGTPQDIYAQSATEFVCNFIGDVNAFSPKVSRQLHADGAAIDPALASYVRIERVGVTRSDAPPRGVLAIPGVVRERRYHGLHYGYRVDLGEGMASAIIPCQDGAQQYEVGDHVVLTIAPAAIMQFPDAPTSESTSQEPARRDVGAA